MVLQPDTFRAFASVYRPLGRRLHGSVGHLSAQDRDAVVRGVEAVTTAFVEARPST